MLSPLRGCAAELADRTRLREGLAPTALAPHKARFCKTNSAKANKFYGLHFHWNQLGADSRPAKSIRRPQYHQLVTDCAFSCEREPNR